MPDFDRYILIIRESNQSLFAAEKIKISPQSLEKLLEKSFWTGFDYCEELQKMKKDSENNDPLNIFKDIFGEKYK